MAIQNGVDVSAVLADVGLQLKEQVGVSIYQCEMVADVDGDVPTREIKTQLEETAEGLKVTVLDGTIVW